MTYVYIWKYTLGCARTWKPSGKLSIFVTNYIWIGCNAIIGDFTKTVRGNTFAFADESLKHHGFNDTDSWLKPLPNSWFNLHTTIRDNHPVDFQVITSNNHDQRHRTAAAQQGMAWATLGDRPGARMWTVRLWLRQLGSRLSWAARPRWKSRGSGRGFPQRGSLGFGA